MAFRKFGTFKTPHGWLTTTGDGEVLQRGSNRGDAVTPASTSNLQFEVTIENENKLKVKRGSVIAGIGKFTDNLGPEICNYEFRISNVFASPLTCSMGSESDSAYINDNGYVQLPSSPVEGTLIGVWIARNMNTIGSYGRLTTQEGYPWLIVDEVVGPLEADTSPWVGDHCDMIDWYMCEDLFHFNPDTLGGFQVYGRYQASADCKPKTYNCQRFPIAFVKFESGKWKIYQYLQGTITLPNPYIFRGNVCNVSEHYDYPPYPNLGLLPAWRLTPEHQTEQNNWETSMATWDKGYAYPTIIYDP